MKIIAVKKNSNARVMKMLREKRSKAADVENAVRKIITEVRRDGDQALRRFSRKFDGVSPQSLQVSRREVEAAYKAEAGDVLRALRRAKANIEKFHRSNVVKKETVVETQKGVKVWREFRPIEKVGLYVPGGRAAYPSTVLMLAVPAVIAGCREIVLCVPPDRSGNVPGAVLVAADLCGVTKIFKIGGAQAIAAMAYGTGSVPKVTKIFGPGNQYVTTAKLLVYGEVAIDMPAGPSEVLVLADDSARADWVAADLLSQLEHGPDSQAVLVCFSKKFARGVAAEIEKQTAELPRKEIIAQSLRRSVAIVADSLKGACELINEYAPEHLEIVVKNEQEALRKIMNAGSVFLGSFSSEPLGDYATGANHTLPTSGYAKMFPPLSVESFGKKVQVQKVTRQGMRNLRNTVETLAFREGLTAHKNAVSIRFKP